MIYLAAGYAVFWIITFVFVYSLVTRQRNLQKELKILEQLAQEETEEK
jgi:CcmD family protein